MKKILTIICVMLAVSNVFADQSQDQDSKAYACYGASEKRAEKVNFKCSEKTLLTAFHELQAAQLNDRVYKKASPPNPEHNKGVPAIARATGKSLITIGGVSFVASSILGLSLPTSTIPINAAREFLARMSFRGFVYGGISAGVGALILIITPNEVTDDTWVGYYCSDDGLADLLKLTDSELLDYSKDYPQISLRVMKIHAILTNAATKIKGNQ